MRASAFLAALSAAAIGRVTAQETKPTDAIEVNDNPIGAVYKAVLPEKSFSPVEVDGDNVKGHIVASSGPDGEGVLFKVKFWNLPKGVDPLTYHIHVEPSENCTKTLAHLDPFIRGEDPPCDPEDKASCQVGDLSGKWGKVTSDPFEAEYLDLYASLKPGIGAFFGNRSFVLHFANKTRISCADFAEVTLPADDDDCDHGEYGHSHEEGEDCDEPSSPGRPSATGSKGPSATDSPPRRTAPVVVAGAAMSSVPVLGVFAAFMFAL